MLNLKQFGRWGVPVAAGCAVMFAAPLARAGWQGDVTIQEQGREQTIAGKIYTEFPHVRMDMQMAGRDVSIITDMKSQKSVMLMHGAKMTMEMQAKDSPVKNFASCSSGDFAACIKKKGYKKVGSEKVDGHPCTVYEGEETIADHKVRQKLWHPNDFKRVFMIKSESRGPGGVSTLAITHVKEGPIQVAMFQPPADYRQMQLPPGMMFGGPAGPPPGLPGGSMESQLPPGHPPIQNPAMGGAPGAGPPGMPPGVQLPPGVKLPPGVQVPAGVTLPPGMMPPPPPPRGGNN